MDCHSLKHAQGRNQTCSATSGTFRLLCLLRVVVLLEFTGNIDFRNVACMIFHWLLVKGLKRSIMEDLIDSVAVDRFILARNAGSENQGY